MEISRPFCVYDIVEPHGLGHMHGSLRMDATVLAQRRNGIHSVRLGGQVSFVSSGSIVHTAGNTIVCRNVPGSAHRDDVHVMRLSQRGVSHVFTVARNMGIHASYDEQQDLLLTSKPCSWRDSIYSGLRMHCATGALLWEKHLHGGPTGLHAGLAFATCNRGASILAPGTGASVAELPVTVGQYMPCRVGMSYISRSKSRKHIGLIQRGLAFNVVENVHHITSSWVALTFPDALATNLVLHAGDGPLTLVDIRRGMAATFSTAVPAYDVAPTFADGQPVLVIQRYPPYLLPTSLPPYVPATLPPYAASV